MLERPTRRELAQTFDMLASLLEARLSLSRAMPVLSRSAPPRARAWLNDIATALKNGASLSQAFREGGLDDPGSIALIRAGEATGKLAEAMRRVAEMLESREEARRRLTSALSYPALLLIGSAGAAFLLVGVVLPRFAQLLGDLGQAPPPLTAFVLAAGQVAAWAVWPSAILLVSLWWIFATQFKTPERRRWRDGVLLDLPQIGEFRARLASSRACETLGAMLSAGLSLAPALRLAAEASGDASLEARLLLTRQAVIEGGSLTGALRAQAALSDDAIALLAAGEEAGRLPQMALQGARLDREWTTRRLQLALRVLEPSLIVGFGLVVALVAGALLQAVYSVRPSA